MNDSHPATMVYPCGGIHVHVHVLDLISCKTCLQLRLKCCRPLGPTNYDDDAT